MRAGGAGHLGGVQPPRRRAGPGDSDPALRRRAEHRRHHDVPAGHEGGGAGQGLRLVHAQAVQRQHPGLRDAIPICRCSRAITTSSTKPGADFQISKVGLGRFDRLRVRHAADNHRGLQPVGQLLQAAAGAGPRRGGGAISAGGTTTCSALIRVPTTSREGQRHPVHRPGVNPYLAFAVILSAGLKGIEEDYELPPGAEDDVWALTSAERHALGIEPLPQSLSDAINVMQRSAVVAEALGEQVFDFFLRNKREEWQEYRRQVTQFELDRYLPVQPVPRRAAPPAERARLLRLLPRLAAWCHAPCMLRNRHAARAGGRGRAGTCRSHLMGPDRGSGIGAVPHVAAIAADRDAILLRRRRAAGGRGEADPATVDTIFRIMSMTKLPTTSSRCRKPSRAGDRPGRAAAQHGRSSPGTGAGGLRRRHPAAAPAGGDPAHGAAAASPTPPAWATASGARNLVRWNRPPASPNVVAWPVLLPVGAGTWHRVHLRTLNTDWLGQVVEAVTGVSRTWP